MSLDLTCYRLGDYTVPLEPARPTREIFDRNRHAYRCLPLSTANAGGWELLCPAGVTVEWDGGETAAAMTVTYDSPDAPQFAKSHFAHGILTFETGWLFRTSEGFGLWVMGSPNDPKDGIAPLTGLVETDWLPYPFTMNWQFTRPGKIRFERGEPFGFITPAQIPVIAECRPRVLALDDDPGLAADHAAWRHDRAEFMERFHARDPEALKTPWRRRYFRGDHPEGVNAPAPDQHINKLRTHAPIVSGSLVAPDAVFSEEGRLTPSPRTRIVRRAADAAGLDFLVLDSLMDAGACEALAQAFIAHGEMAETHHKDTFWQNRLIGLGALEEADPRLAGTMRDTVHRAIGEVAAFYGESSDLYADVVHLAGWNAGQFMRAHADNANPDGTPHPMAHRVYSGVLYLNDDYEGGGVYLPAQDVLIQPARGMFVSLPAGPSHTHSVVRVEHGRRVTMPFFLTLDPAKADRRIHRRSPAPLGGLSWDGVTGDLTFASVTQREDA